MGNDCYFQVLNLGALATMIGVTKLHMDDYTEFHPNFTHSSKIGNLVHLL